LIAVNLPLSAWAVSGMETPWILITATVALTGGLVGALAAGFAAAWRPELLPWAFVVTLAQGIVVRAPTRRTLQHSLVALAPSIVIAGLRFLIFSVPVPLSFFAKPSDLGSGFRYCLGALLGTGLPWLALAPPKAYSQLPPRLKAVLPAGLIHALSLILAGGDWMPFWRLMVPLLPGFLWIGVGLRRPRWLTVVLLSAVLATSTVLHVYKGPSARRVVAERAELIRAFGEVADHHSAELGLSSDSTTLSLMAALDVGWLGAALPGTVVDLAGVTDARIAHLPGGHTSKRLPLDFIKTRNIRSAVLLFDNGAPGGQTEGTPARAVERRLLALPGATPWRSIGAFPLNQNQTYHVLVFEDQD
jgi:hypothetical protein